MMVEQKRRQLLGTLLGLIPGTLFHRGVAFASTEEQQKRAKAADTLEAVFATTDKADLYSTVRAANLPAEDKVAVVAVRELKETELRRCLSSLRKAGSVASEGRVCGTNCGNDCGTMCGVSCSGMARGALGVIDRQGKLGLTLKGLDTKRIVASSEKLLDMK